MSSPRSISHCKSKITFKKESQSDSGHSFTVAQREPRMFTDREQWADKTDKHPRGKCHDTLTESTQCPPTHRTEVVRPPFPTLPQYRKVVQSSRNIARTEAHARADPMLALAGGLLPTRAHPAHSSSL
ncbi:hypothetical protein GQ607_000552 [Colletotrichum asianum]|uniref:Uncharacterized protein n=1 Tax=Colletotrichum asianum TaxID=702518 RepID=A0A8H3WPZ2_9PEZI|nr:hypothetical protein GQ607_000552 [Colletotrichum asianum]